MAVSSPERVISPATSTRPTGSWALAGLSAALAAPALAGVVSLFGKGWFPAGDHAVIGRRVADVGSRHTPLVGVYSRFGWEHPGPLMFYVLAPFRYLGGDRGLLVGAAFINIVALVGALLLARRRGGVILMSLVGVFLAILCHALGAGFLLDPWNPYVPVLAFAGFILLAWSVACGDTALWPGLVAAGTWEVQAHAGYAPLVAALLGAVVTCRLLARTGVEFVNSPATRGHPNEAGGPDQPEAPGHPEPADRTERAGHPKPAGHPDPVGHPEPAGWLSHPGWQAVVVGGLLWLLPILEQLLHSPGNLRLILRYALSHHDQTLGLSAALHVAGKQLSLLPPWVNGHDTSYFGFLATGPILPVVIEILVVAGLGWLAWVRREREAAVLAGFTVVVVVAAIADLAKIDGLPFPYLAKWMLVIALFVPLSMAWSLGRLGRPSLRVEKSGFVAVAVGMAACLSVVTSVSTWRSPDPEPILSNALAHLLPATRASLDPSRSYVVESMEIHALGLGMGMGLHAGLEERGVHAYLPDSLTLEAGSWRTNRHRQIDMTVTVASSADATVNFDVPAHWRLVAHWDPRSAADQALAYSLEGRIRQALGAQVPPTSPIITDTAYASSQYVAKGASAEDIARLGALQRKGDAYSVFLHETRYPFPISGP